MLRRDRLLLLKELGKIDGSFCFVVVSLIYVFGFILNRIILGKRMLRNGCTYLSWILLDRFPLIYVFIRRLS